MSPPGFEDLLAQELRELGLGAVRQVEGGVEFEGGWSAVYRANLFSRVAVRILVRVAGFTARHFKPFRTSFAAVDWERWLPAGCAIDLRVASHRSRLYHTGRLREECAAVLGEQRAAAVMAAGQGELRLQVRLHRDRAVISLDTSGEALYRRGYRTHVGAAPLRENLAAALLLRCGWRREEPLLDPFCGSGAFVVEAALLAAGIAPGRARSFAFERLPAFDAALWRQLRAASGTEDDFLVEPGIFGADRDEDALRLTARAVRRAEVGDAVAVARSAVHELEAPAAAGLVIANPPYGRRLRAALPAYRGLGQVLRGTLCNWRWAVIVPNHQAQQALALPPAESYDFRNGGLRLRFLVGQPHRR